MAVCLLPEKVADFRQALKNKDLDIGKLMNMSSEERTATFKDYAGDNAKDVNTMFEQKLVLKNRIAGLKNWAAKLGEVGKYSESGKADVAKALADYRAKQTERIFSPQEDEAFLNDLADKATGTHISREVAGKVFDMAQKMDDLKDKNVTSAGVSNEYLQAKTELDKYIQDQHPQSALSSVAHNLATIFRNNLLLNPSTPIKTVIGQTLNSAIDFATRRIAAGLGKGDNGAVKSELSKDAWNTFKKTGQNTTQMESIDDTHNTLAEGKNFEVPEDANTGSKIGMKAANLTGKVAKLSTKAAIYYEHQISFSMFHQKAFFDSADIFSTKMAKEEGLAGRDRQARAEEIMRDAARIEPETAEGAFVRQQAQAQAARVTSTNKTWLSNQALNFKNILNKEGEKYGNVPIGDLLVPIAKIPANIIWNGIENAGAGIPRAALDIFQGRSKMQSGDLKTRYEGMAQFSNGIQMTARMVGTIGVSYLIANSIPKSNFKQDQYGTTYVKIGTTWINAEYFSAISPSLSGFMSVKSNSKKGAKADNVAGAYASGVTKSLSNFPGVTDVLSTFQNPSKGASDFFTSRGLPAFIPNLLNDRPINRLFFGAHGVESTQDVAKDKQKSPKAVI